MSQKLDVPNALRAAVRKAGLHGSADKLRYYLTRARRWRSNVAYRQANPNVVFPPPYMLYEAFNLDYRLYLEDGRDTAAEMATYLRPYLSRPGSVFLDWGCGPARLTRHFPELLPATCDIHAIDVNPATIAWCKAALPEIEFRLCGLLPPLDCPDGAIDAALGLSVLTHLSVDAHRAWMVEFGRVIRSGGVLVVTTHGEEFSRRLAVEDARGYDSGGIFAIPYEVEGHRLYGAYHPESGMRALVDSEFDVVEHVRGQVRDWGVEQDIWILRRR